MKEFFFYSIENNLREIGHGDVTVNKKMKNYNQIFHDLLMKFIDKKTFNEINSNEMMKFLESMGDVDLSGKKVMLFG